MQNNNTVRVRIVKCGNRNYWYKGLIGKEYEVVEDKDYQDCWIINPEDITTSIWKSDCIIIEPEKSNHPDEVKRKGIDAFDTSMKNSFEKVNEGEKAWATDEDMRGAFTAGLTIPSDIPDTGYNDYFNNYLQSLKNKKA